MVELLSGTGQLFLTLIQNLITLFFVALLVAGAVAAVVFIRRFFLFNISADFFELKNDNDVSYLGGDIAKPVTKKGVKYINFLRRKGLPYEHNTMPESKFFYKKGFFGSRIFFLIVNDEMIPCSMGIVQGKNLALNALTNTQKISYIQRHERYMEDYKKQGLGIQKAAVVISIAAIGIIAFGLFVIWQSNESTAAATQALAQAVTSARSAPTLPAGV